MKKGKPEEPKIYAIKKNDNGVSFTRKEFLGTVAAIGAGLALNPKEVFAEKILDTGKEMNLFQAHVDDVSSICYSPDGKLLISSGGYGAIKLWSTPDGKLIKTLEKSTNLRTSICINPDGKILATIGHNEPIKLWSIPDGKITKELGIHYGSQNKSICFSPDGKFLVSVGSSHSKRGIKLWSIPNGKLLKTFKEQYPLCVSINPIGNIMAIGDYNYIKLWSISDGKRIKKFKKLTNDLKSLCFSPDGKLLASGGKNLQLWSIPDGKLLNTIVEHSGLINSVKFSPDGRILVSGGDDSTIRLWSLPEGKLLNTLKGHSGSVNSVSYSPDGKILATGGDDGMIRLWSMPEGDPCYLLFDPEIMKKSDGMEVEQMGPETVTLPCGTPIPSGATCICDCVAASRTYPGTELVCTCNTILVPAGTILSDNMVCQCNTIAVGGKSEKVCSCNAVQSCTCNKVCTCDSVSTPSYYTYYTTYWYPN